MSPLVAAGVALGWLAGPRLLRALSGVSHPHVWAWSTTTGNGSPECGVSVAWQGRAAGVFVTGRPELLEVVEPK